MIDHTIIDKDYMETLMFDKMTNSLYFVIKHYHREPKISGYITRNHIRIPIYNDYKERTSAVKTYNRVIQPLKFVNIDILNLNIDREFILQIIEKINIIPAWRQKELDLSAVKTQIDEQTSLLRDYELEQERCDFLPTDYNEQPTPIFWVIFWSLLTLGIALVFCVSKKQALENAELNKTNAHTNVINEASVKERNLNLKNQIDLYNGDINVKIKTLTAQYNQITKRDVSYPALLSSITVKPKTSGEIDNDWYDIKQASVFRYPQLVNKKGVYIIWNKTKDKYYVGQSKNLKNRLLNHFKDGEVQNIRFSKDYYEGDEFVYQYKFCDSKDELDDLERQYIYQYAAFDTGYNRTNGNI